MIGKTISNYKIIEKLGEGGMGVVYKAQDTKLGREVALKALPEEFAQDRERLARFEREAKLLASLNHPNIATIYGLEQSEGLNFLILELVEGETLAGKLTSGPIKVQDALEMCRQIAEALESAHQKGIIHRDLKPSNIKVTPEDKVKVLDFGLAKAFEVAEIGDVAGMDPYKSPTLTVESSRSGVIMGTAAYMSPEQARGKPLDKRTDIWSFGCVFFELLTGRQLFKGETTSDMVAGILKQEPDWMSLPKELPVRIRDLLRRCLQKDPNKRLHDIADARIEIEDALSETPLPTSEELEAGVSRRVTASWWITALLLIITAIIVGITTWILTRREAPSISRRFIIMPSLSAPLTTASGTDVAVSPDGMRIAYVADTGTSLQLYMYLVNEFEARPLVGTEGAQLPFFSQDGKWLGFYSQSSQKLMKIPILDGKSIPLEICSAPSVFSAYWGDDDTILFGSRGFGYGIRRVSARGGEPEAITVPEIDKDEISHDSPILLPDGQTILYVVIKKEGYEESLIVAQDLVTGERKTLAKGGTNIAYVPTGHLVCNREGTLLVAPFHQKQLRVGNWIPVVDDIRAGGSIAGEFSFSMEGTLAYVHGLTWTETYLIWIDNLGRELPLIEKRNRYGKTKISPDSRRLALSIWDKEISAYNIWIYDLQSGVFEQITFEGNNYDFAWSPDGQRLAFVNNSEGSSRINLIYLEDERKTETLWNSDYYLFNISWSPDGNWLVFDSRGSETKRDIWKFSFKDNEAAPYLNTISNEGSPTFSADGKWIAYASDEQGSFQIYARPFFGEGDKRKISLEGGFDPKWAVSGNKLFYQSKNKIMAVSVATMPRFQILGRPETVYDKVRIWNYDIHPRDNRLLLVKESGEYTDLLQIRVVLNWFEELKRHFEDEN